MNPSNEGRNVRRRTATELDEEWDREVDFTIEARRRNQTHLSRFAARRTAPANPDENEAEILRQRHVQDMRTMFIRFGMPTSPVSEAEDDPIIIEDDFELENREERVPVARLDDVAGLEYTDGDGVRVIDLVHTWREHMNGDVQLQ